MLDNTGKRQLVYLVKIDAITPIEKADRLEAAHVGGWVVVVSKGEFKVGDPAIYLEIDSQVAIDKAPWCDMDFLVSKKGKIKTQKIRGQISQGLLVPVTAFGWTICENTVIKDDKGEYHHIDDESRFLTKQLGITYSSVEDRKRKGAAPDEYKKMAQRHPEFGKKWWWKKLYRSNLGKKILFVFFGKKKDSAIAFPTKFPGVTVTDQERCVIGQTKILTDQGPIQISKIVNQQLPVKVLSVNNETGKFEWKRILQYQKFKNDYKPVLTIGYPYSPGVKTRLNHICCTPDHRFLTQRGYIHAKDLQTTDYLYMPEDAFGEECLGAIYGMLLGDSHIYDDKRSHGKLRIVATNGEAQLDYLKYKQSVFNGEGKICNAGKGSFENAKDVYHWFLPVDGYISQEVEKHFYSTGKKIVTEAVVDRLNDEGLAFWYMDDGNLSYRNDPTKRCNIRLNTQGFSLGENELLCNALATKWGLKCHITKEERKDKPIYYHIFISADSTPDFLKIVTPYMCESMAYKTTADLEYLIGTKSSHYVRENRPVKVPVLSVELGQHKNVSISQSFKFVYDLEVEDNHNFVADNVVTHNCENMTWVLRDKTPFIVTQKCDGSSGTFILERKKFGKYEFYVCSRNVRQLKPEQKCFYDENYYWQVAIKYDIENKMKAWLKAHPKAWFVCWQGEVCGPKIQSNPQHLSEYHLFCFHWTDSINGRRDIREADKDWRAMGMEVVPIEGTIVLPDDFEEFKQMADGKYDPSVCEGHKDCNREGWVLYKTNEPTFSFKNVSRKYLLGKKD